jgi:FkbM family methyltransferase
MLCNSGYLVQKRTHMAFGIDHAMDIIRFAKGIYEINTIFDIGANIGQSTQYYSKNFPKAKIYSFEPIRNTFNELFKNTHSIQNTHCYQIAMGSQSEEVEVELQTNSQWNSLAGCKIESAGKKEKVIVKTVDEFMSENKIKNISILKIDTEGYEIQVLKGAKKFLNNCKNTFIYIETTFIKEDNTHTQFVDIYQELYRFGFRFVGIYEQNYNSFNPARPPLGYCNTLFYK